MNRCAAPEKSCAGPEILWINGAFGAGKTETARVLSALLPKAFLFDPEETGDYIRSNLPESVREPDFQDYPMWRQFNGAMLAYLARRWTGTVLVPMTVTSPAYFAELVRFPAEICRVRRFLLEASESWPARQIGRCLAAFEAGDWGERIATDGLTVRQTAERIAERALGESREDWTRKEW